VDLQPLDIFLEVIQEQQTRLNGLTFGGTQSTHYRSLSRFVLCRLSRGGSFPPFSAISVKSVSFTQNFSPLLNVKI